MTSRSPAKRPIIAGSSDGRRPRRHRAGQRRNAAPSGSDPPGPLKQPGRVIRSPRMKSMRANRAAVEATLFTSQRGRCDAIAFWLDHRRILTASTPRTGGSAQDRERDRESVLGLPRSVRANHSLGDRWNRAVQTGVLAPCGPAPRTLGPIRRMHRVSASRACSGRLASASSPARAMTTPRHRHLRERRGEASARPSCGPLPSPSR